MARNRLLRLIEIASEAFCSGDHSQAHIPEKIRPLLRARNGFFAFESALRVFPSGGSALSYSIEQWNSHSLWRDRYGNLTDGLFFFAEDIFGGQFCLKDDLVFTFDPETAETKKFADSLEAWAECVLDDYDFVTGYSLGHEWQQRFGGLQARDRLFPKVPFVFGGQFEVTNLEAIDGARGMCDRGPIALQLNGVPDGTKVKLTVRD